MTRRYLWRALLLLLSGCGMPAFVAAQTLGVPVPTRGDSTITGTASVTWPAVYDSSRAVVTICGQVRVQGVTKTRVCRTKTGPWVRRAVAPAPLPVSSVSSVRIAPKTASLLTGAVQPFNATAFWVTGATADSAVTSGFTFTATGGALTPIGQSTSYTAGPMPGSYRVVARHVSGKADTAAVTITAPAPPSVLSRVQIDPHAVSLHTGASWPFTGRATWMTGTTTDSVVTTGFTFAATGGTITSAGLYTAGNATGTFRVIATYRTGRADTAVVTVTAPPAPGVYATITAKDWSRYTAKSDLAGLFGVEGGMHDCSQTADKTLCEPLLPVTAFYDLVADPVFGKVVRYNGGPQLNTVLTTRPGRVAVHGVSFPGVTHVWVRQFVRFSPNYTTTSATGGQGAASHKLLFLRFPGSARSAVILEGPRSWTIEHGSATASPHPATNVIGTNAECGVTGWPGGADIASYDPMFKMDVRAGTCPAVPQGDGEWYEVLLEHKQTSTTTATWVTAWRRISQNGQRATLPGPWRINGRIDVTAGTWQWAPIYRYEMGVNRNRQWDEPMSIDWGPYEVVDGTKYPNPFNAPW